MSSGKKTKKTKPHDPADQDAPARAPKGGEAKGLDAKAGKSKSNKAKSGKSESGAHEAKKSASHDAKNADTHAARLAALALDPASAEPPPPLREKDYRALLKPLHAELVHLQRWVIETGAKICIVFEGRDGAGKGGVIKALTERVSPRVFRVVALPAPSEREKTQLYVQRYLPYLPAGGEITIWDRSWYNRAGVERVMGFCTDEVAQSFLRRLPDVERMIVDSGTILVKYWLEVSQEEQQRRLEGRITDGRKTWKLSPMDLRSYSRWYDYSRARDEMFLATDTAWAPWYVVPSDDKKRARLNVLAHLLRHIPYEVLPPPKVKLPKRQKQEDYREPDYPYKFVPDHITNLTAKG